jgi:hypothetical protein
MAIEENPFILNILYLLYFSLQLAPDSDVVLINDGAVVLPGQTVYSLALQ